MSKKVIIIGSGIAGLTAGIYAKRSGFDVTIFEQHTIPGGMCTSWRRNGYLFEGAIHWLVGSSPKTPLYQLWQDVGALGNNIKVRYDEPFKSIEHDGGTVCLYRNLKKLQEHFDALSPEDSVAIKRLVSDIKSFTKVEMPIVNVKGVKSEHSYKMSMGKMIKMMSALPKMGKIGKMSVSEYTAMFKHPAIRTLLNNAIKEDYNAVGLLTMLATFVNGDGGYPEGGSLAMVRRMADTFISLGGKMQLSIKVDKVIVENGKAVGVKVNGQNLFADAVIITQETLAASEQLFDIPPQDEWLMKLKREIKPEACCFVGVGIKAHIKETPMFILPKPIQCGGFSYPMMSFNNYSEYQGYAPEGCTTLTAVFAGDSYDFWKKAYAEGRYETEKQAIAEQISNVLCEKYPQVKDKIEIIDVATPLTYERYTGASKGSWMSAMSKGDTVSLSCRCTLEGIEGVYFAGHVIMQPGGLPAALITGRSAAQMVCKQFDVVFK